MANVKLENVVTSLQSLKKAHTFLEELAEKLSGEDKEKLLAAAKEIYDVGQNLYTTSQVEVKPRFERLKDAASLVQVMVQFPLTLSFGEVNGSVCTVINAFNPELKEALPLAILLDQAYVEVAEKDLNLPAIPPEVNAELNAIYNNQHPEIKKTSSGAAN